MSVTPLREEPAEQTLPPHDEYAEQCLIAAALVDNDVYRRGLVEVSDFYEGVHQRIWRRSARR